MIFRPSAATPRLRLLHHRRPHYFNNSLISQTKVTASGQTGYPNYGNLYFPADTTADGFYRVLVVEYEGDTRGNPWYSNLICLAADTSASSNTGAVKAYG